jgi:hypothetical protein
MYPNIIIKLFKEIFLSNFLPQANLKKKSIKIKIQFQFSIINRKLKDEKSLLKEKYSNFKISENKKK